jgi:energy-coupling factor transporter ATP-binding protein EcfA2
VFDEITGGGDEIELGKKTVARAAYVSWFNFKGRDQQKKTGMLSGGERNRVHLAKLLRKGSNLLLLDEPTNDLDVDTLRALEDALLEFAGCAVVISHDRWFLDRIATHMLAFEGDSEVVWFEGNYQDYEGRSAAPPRRGCRPAAPHQVPQADPVTTMTTPEIERRPGGALEGDDRRAAARRGRGVLGRRRVGGETDRGDAAAVEEAELSLQVGRGRWRPERQDAHLLKLRRSRKASRRASS